MPFHRKSENARHSNPKAYIFIGSLLLDTYQCLYFIEIGDSSWSVKQEMKPSSPILAGAPSGASALPSAPPAPAGYNPNEVQMIMSRLADMTALIQTQRAEVQVWREEMRALRREDVGSFKSVLDDSTTEATNEMKKTTQVGMATINRKNPIID